MLKNIRNIAISKQFLISVFFIALMFTAFGVDIDDSYAVDVNETNDDLGIELDVEDKLENSQNDESLQAIHRLNGGTFNDIKTTIRGARAGDVIVLNGNFTAESASDMIPVTKQLTIKSTSSATLDGKNLCVIMGFGSGAANTLVSNIRFVNGNSPDEGGAVRIFGKSLTFESCTFENNAAKFSSGALHTSYDPRAVQGLTVKNCIFKNNEAGIAAGALGVFAYDFKIENCVFESNKVQIKNSSNCYGGAIQVGVDTDISYGVVSNCEFYNNVAISAGGVSHGGAGCLRNNTYYKNCIFVGNSADHGGAVTFHASGNLENCRFYNNTANNYGGALSISMEQNTMVLTLNNCIFEGNSAPMGGAAKLDGLNIKIQNSDFNGNTATEYGGAVNIDATDVSIISSHFNENIANINGGAVYISGQNTVISDSSFIKNEAIPNVNNLNDGLGGAVFVRSNQATIQNNEFRLNTARNGSAVYYDNPGNGLTLSNNIMQENQAWVYALPIYAHDIYYGDVENISSVIYGGNNIAKYNNLDVSNAIYNAESNRNIKIDSETPVLGATMSGELYQDDREYNMDVLLKVTHEDGTVVYDKTLKSSYLGEVSDVLEDLKPGLYTVESTHFEDTYYKGITNITTFRVIPKIDNRILKGAKGEEEYNFEDIVVWTLNITNHGPNDATEVVVSDVLPDGLIYVIDDSGGKYNSTTGILTIGNLSVGESIIVNIITIVNKTGMINNSANVTAHEYDVNLTNNKDNASIDVNPAIDLSVKKSVNNTNPNYNDLVDWCIVVKNNGPDVAHDVKAYDVLPTSLIYGHSDGNYDVNSGCWDIGVLGIGEEVKLHIICRVNSTGLIENNVSVTGHERDHDTTNNFDTAVIAVDSSCDLWIEKSVNSSTANYGDLVKWTLVISNNGPDNATGVHVVDTLPEGFIYVDSNLDKGKYSNGVISIDSLAVGERLTLEIICRVNNTGNFTNVANITSEEYDYDMTNNVDNASISIASACDLEVIKQVDNPNPNFNDTVTWSVTVINHGPDTAHDIRVYDILLESLIWVNDDSQGKYDLNSGLWKINQLDVGSSAILNIVCRVNGTGSITNHVNVTGREFDYNLTNNEADEKIMVNSSADLSVEKSVNNSSPNYGEYITWTLIIKNNGPDKANGVYVEEKLPEGLILIGYNATKGIYDNDVWAMCCLNSSETQTLKIFCLVNKTGNLTNVVVISSDEYDPNPENNVDNETIEVPSAVDLKLTKQVNNSTPDYGDEIIWTITVTNGGPDNASGVVVEDLMPQGLILVGWNASKGSYSANKWEIGSLNVGCSEQLNITCIANQLEEITNYAEVKSNEHDWNESNNHDFASVDVGPIVDLAVEKSVNNTHPNYCDRVKWTITVRNYGPNDAFDVYVRDMLPEGLDLVESSRASYSNGIWDIGFLSAGDSITLELITKVSATGNFTNNATVFCHEKDVNPSNNYDESTIAVPPASDISITKVVSRYYHNLGDLIEYAISVFNKGPDRATKVAVDEVFDDSLSLRSYKASAGDFNKLTKRWDIESLDTGESASLLIEAVGTKEGISNNAVNASSDNYDPDLSNNNDSVAVEISNNTQKIPITPKKANVNKTTVHDAQISKIAVGALQEHVTGNSIFILLISVVLSIVFLSEGYSKKR